MLGHNLIGQFVSINLGKDECDICHQDTGEELIACEACKRFQTNKTKCHQQRAYQQISPAFAELEDTSCLHSCMKGHQSCFTKTHEIHRQTYHNVGRKSPSPRHKKASVLGDRIKMFFESIQIINGTARYQIVDSGYTSVGTFLSEQSSSPVSTCKVCVKNLQPCDCHLNYGPYNGLLSKFTRSDVCDSITTSDSDTTTSSDIMDIDDKTFIAKSFDDRRHDQYKKIWLSYQSAEYLRIVVTELTAKANRQSSALVKLLEDRQTLHDQLESRKVVIGQLLKLQMK